METMKKASALVAGLGAALAALVLYRMWEWPIYDTPGVIMRWLMLCVAAAQVVPFAGLPIFFVLSRRSSLSLGARVLWFIWLCLALLVLALGALVGVA